jgi:hypothetical protein
MANICFGDLARGAFHRLYWEAGDRFCIGKLETAFVLGSRRLLLYWEVGDRGKRWFKMEYLPSVLT